MLNVIILTKKIKSITFFSTFVGLFHTKKAPVSTGAFLN